MGIVFFLFRVRVTDFFFYLVPRRCTVRCHALCRAAYETEAKKVHRWVEAQRRQIFRHVDWRRWLCYPPVLLNSGRANIPCVYTYTRTHVYTNIQGVLGFHSQTLFRYIFRYIEYNRAKNVT